MSRVYLDHNATSPLRPEARAAMAEGERLVGNPSSIHAEGRAAKAALERARESIRESLGGARAGLTFTSGATEAAALALAGRGLACAAVEHEAVLGWCAASLPVDRDGRIGAADPARSCVQIANGETGVVQDLPSGLAVTDLTQGAGKQPYAHDWSGIAMAFLSAHKFGGPRGIGALLHPDDAAPQPRQTGGGQEMGWRAGTENLIGAMGFAAALAAALRDLADGVWHAVAARRELFEARVLDGAPEAVIAGQGARRLPNTSLVVSAGWPGGTQVMAMDLAGFAVSSGSACSSGKVRASKVLTAMGLEAGSAMRVSLSPDTTDDEVLRAADTWLALRSRHRARAA